MAQRAQARGTDRPHGDATGRQGRALQDEMVESEQEREAELTQARQADHVEYTTAIVDVTTPTPSVIYEDSSADQEAQDLVAELAESEDPKVQALLKHFVQAKARDEVVRTGGLVTDGDGKVIVRVNADIDEMTFGKDPKTGEIRNFSFQRGRRYRVDEALAIHLDRNNRLWH